MRQKNKRGDKIIEKWDQTENPEIPDRGETSEIPGLPSGEHTQRTATCGWFFTSG